MYMVDLEEFRDEVRVFFAGRYARRDPLQDDDREDTISRATAGHDHLVEDARELQRALADAGLSGVHLPTEFGGRGLTGAHSEIVMEEWRRFDAPSLRPLGIGMHLAVATLMHSASDAQRRRYLPALVRADEQWCQLFSEPDAGSDLVSLRCRAVRDGDEWIIDGQKVWSSYAANAHFGLLLARTDPHAPKPHVGITMFILPMDAAGVTVRPLIDIAGGRHFNEVFLDHVRLSADSVIGEVNLGWGVSQGTLGGERSGYMGGSGNGRRLRQLVAAARTAGKLHDPLVRQEMMRVVSAERILEWLRDRLHAGTLAGGSPAAGSMMKVIGGSLEQRVAEVIADLAGAHCLAWEQDDPDGDRIAYDLNATRQATIAGGTHQIQRNLLGERVLGLPREPK